MIPEEIGRKYDKVAAWWDARHRDSLYGMAALENALAWRTDGKRALDVGCGSGGRMIRRLLAAGYEVTGIDVSPKMIALARANHPEAEFHLGDFMEWEGGRGFDLIVAWDSLFHLPAASQASAIGKLSRCLGDGGILLHTFGDAVGDHEDLSFRDPEGGQFGELDNDLFGYGGIGVEGVRRALEANGCTVLELELDQPPGPHAFAIARQELRALAHWVD